MRVLFLVSYFPRPQKPLIGTWALEQAKALANASDLLVACTTPYIPSILGLSAKAKPWINVPKKYRWDNVDIRYLKNLYYPVNRLKKMAYPDPRRQMSIAWKSAKKRLLKIIAEFKPDVLFCHHSSVNGYYAYRLNQLTKIPYVITDHDFGEINSCETLPGRKAFYDPIMQNASRNIAVSTRMEADIKRIFPQAKTTTLYNGINLSSTTALKTERPPELQGKTIILSAGMFAPRKAFPLLVEAFARVASTYPNAILRIGGDGEQRPQTEQAIAAHNLQDRVRLLGLLPHQQIFQEMLWSDVFALISWDEPFATVFLEAMGMGKPVITCSDGGITDVVKDRVHGLIVPPKDIDAAAQALSSMIANPAERQQMGQNAKQLILERLTWQANTRQLLEILQAAAHPTL
jgi:glycosyltransferase involved in cell wall biosynthesis